MLKEKYFKINENPKEKTIKENNIPAENLTQNNNIFKNSFQATPVAAVMPFTPKYIVEEKENLIYQCIILASMDGIVRKKFIIIFIIIFIFMLYFIYIASN